MLLFWIDGPDVLVLARPMSRKSATAQFVRCISRAMRRMFCLAGIAAKVELIEKSTRSADRLLVVDGCDSDCARKTMEADGFGDFIHLRVSDLGFEKGKTPDRRAGNGRGKQTARATRERNSVSDRLTLRSLLLAAVPVILIAATLIAIVALEGTSSKGTAAVGPPMSGTEVIAYYFHATVRCTTCPMALS